jgi:hypothetical protein
MCPQHHEFLTLWCSQCKCSMCATCSLSTRHNDHNVKLFEDARETTQQELNEILKEADDVYSQALKNEKALEGASTQLEEVVKTKNIVD